MRLLCSLALFLCSGILISQEFNIKGNVSDPEGRPLGSATIYVEKPADSSLVTYTISDGNGDFELKGKSASEKLNFYITYAGFKPYFKTLDASTNDLGTIKMEVSSNELDEIPLLLQELRSPSRQIRWNLMLHLSRPGKMRILKRC